MKKRLFLSALAALAFALPCPARSQVEINGDVGEPSQTFVVDALSFAYDSTYSRLDVFIQVGYDNLSFVRSGDKYNASYELTTTLYDSANTVVTEGTTSEEIKGVTFDQSVAAGAFKVTQKVFKVTPGRYSIGIQLQDSDSKNVRRLSRQVTVSDFSHGNLALSDIMLVAKVAQDGSRKTIVPSISSNIGNLSDPIHIFMEAYERQRADSLRFEAMVKNDKGETVIASDTVQYLTPGKNEVFFKIDHTHLPLGDFHIVVAATPTHPMPEAANQILAATGRAVVVRWRGLPMGVKNLDLAIEQLRYIAKDKEMSTMKDAETIQDKQRLFLEFWKKRDPNPNTPRNERMEQYYARVEYANKHFSHFMEGWRTDMGMVFITFGPPNNVERHPFDIDSKPYEVWGYYDLNYQFVFVDQTGFGDYRLTTPMWETMGHFRD